MLVLGIESKLNVNINKRYGRRYGKMRREKGVAENQRVLQRQTKKENGACTLSERTDSATGCEGASKSVMLSKSII